MSFGFSVGDFLTVIELASKVRKDFAKAPDQFQQLTYEIRNLTIVLNDIIASFDDYDLSETQTKSLHNIHQSCRRILEETQAISKEYSTLESTAVGIRHRAKRVWKRVKWEPDEVRDLRSRITSNVTVLNSFTAIETSRAVFNLQQQQDRQEHRQKLQEILDWLTSTDTAAQQADFIRRRQPGTGQWLIESPKYNNWKAANGEILFCHGIPGAGKTILSSIVVDDLQESYANKDIAICYFYCNFQRQDEQRLENVVLSFIKQLAQITITIPDCLQEMFDRCQAKRGRPSLEELTKTLYSIARSFSRIFVVVDAIDECQTADGSQRKLVSELMELKTATKANILATSRPIFHIMEEFKDQVSLEVFADPKDIQKYVEGNIQDLPRFVNRSPDLVFDITAAILVASDGMFLLAKLHLESLKGKRSSKELQKSLLNLASGSDAYVQAYHNTMTRIYEGNKELAVQALIWIVYAKRKLTKIELQHALGVEVDELEFHEESIVDLHETISACCGLVTIDEESDIVRLVHYTTQEFFERQGASYLPNAHVEIAHTCVAHLSIDEFSSGRCLEEDDLVQRLTRFPFYDYASHYWGFHAAELETSEFLQEFLSRPGQVEASSQALLVDRWSRCGFEQAPSQVTALHLAAYFGLSVNMVRNILDKFDVNAQDSNHRTPLMYASGHGHEGIVRLLLQNSAQIDSTDSSGRTPLSWATEYGHEAVIRFLLEENAQVDIPDKNGQTPLLWAFENGEKAIIRMLLDNNAQVDVLDKNGETPLSWAARNGDEAMVHLLLDKKAQVDTPDKDGETPLSWAAKMGHEAIVRSFLEKNAQIDTPDDIGRTPLSWAAQYGRETIVRLLLDQNAQVDSPDNKGQTLLSWAARNGHEAVVRLLLSNNAQVNTPDENGETPLSWAARYGHESIVRLLLEKNAQVDIKDFEYEQTPLSWAARYGHESIVRLLLEHS